jgi:hypothetical protein
MKLILVAALACTLLLQGPPLSLAAEAGSDPFMERFGLNQDPDQVLQRVLSGEEFSYASIWDRIQEAYIELIISGLEALNELLPDLDISWPLEGSGKFEGDIFSLGLLTLAGLLVIGLIIWIIVRTAALRRSPGRTPLVISDDGLDLSGLTSRELREQAREALEKGDYPRAVIYFFRSFILRLDEEEVIQLRAGLTNREILRRIDPESPHRDILRKMIPLFNRVRYGTGGSDQDTALLFQDLSQGRDTGNNQQ